MNATLARHQINAATYRHIAARCFGTARQDSIARARAELAANRDARDSKASSALPDTPMQKQERAAA